jgi:hypothetical protein
MENYEKIIRDYLKGIGFNNTNVKLVREFVSRIENGYVGSKDDLLDIDEVKHIKTIIKLKEDFRNDETSKFFMSLKLNHK